MTESSKKKPTKKRWRKPTLYDMTEYIDTGGGPTLKIALSEVAAEDESRPDTTARGKTYRPWTG